MAVQQTTCAVHQSVRLKIKNSRVVTRHQLTASRPPNARILHCHNRSAGLRALVELQLTTPWSSSSSSWICSACLQYEHIFHHYCHNCTLLLKTRNSSGDEIANVNFLYDDIIHALQNTIDSCVNSVTYRCGYVLERRFTKFSEITQCNGQHAVQGHSVSPILVSIESSCATSY